MRYSIWMTPKDPVRSILRDIILRLSREFHTPFFEPHVTLCWPLHGTEEEWKEKTAKLARELHPFTIALREPAVGSKYFECVFLKTEGSEDARRSANELFGIDGPY